MLRGKKNMSEDNEKTPQKDQGDVEIVIEVSRDELEAYLTLIPLNQPPQISVDKIHRALSERKITYGINDDIIGELLKGNTFNERVLIAEGTKPVEGKDGRIRYLHEHDGSVKVRKGDKIGEILPPEQGTEGTGVTDKKIPVRAARQAVQPNLIQIEVSDDGKILKALVDGYFSVTPAVAQVTPFFELKVSDDEHQAHVTVVKPIQADDFTGENLKTFLKDNGIVYGILEQEIENIFSREKYGQPVLVAQGKDVIDDKDGAIKYLFETMAKAFMDDKGNIDYKELNLIQNVLQGEALAEIIPPVPGEMGYTVFGKEIPPKKGAAPSLPVGKNTKPNPNNPNVLISEIEGCVRLKGTTVEVDSLFVIKENVDYSTGNINFKGSIMINGDVKSGFKVNVRDDVQINGVLEDASVEAGGNVLLKKGFIGKGKGHIIARGTVNAKFCENEAITAEGDIHISDYAMNSRIQTRGHLFVKDKTGLILGGDSFAVKGIEAKVVGNKSYLPTRLSVGVDMVSKSYMENNIRYLEEVEKILEKFSRRKLVKKALPDNIREMIDGLHRIMKDKEEENKKLIEETEETACKAEELKKGDVKIHTMAYPGTWITIFDKFMEVTEPRKSVRYLYSDEDILAADL